MNKIKKIYEIEKEFNPGEPEEFETAEIGDPVELVIGNKAVRVRFMKWIQDFRIFKSLYSREYYLTSGRDVIPRSYNSIKEVLDIVYSELLAEEECLGVPQEKEEKSFCWGNDWLNFVYSFLDFDIFLSPRTKEFCIVKGEIAYWGEINAMKEAFYLIKTEVINESKKEEDFWKYYIDIQDEELLLKKAQRIERGIILDWDMEKASRQMVEYGYDDFSYEL